MRNECIKATLVRRWLLLSLLSLYLSVSSWKATRAEESPLEYYSATLPRNSISPYERSSRQRNLYLRKSKSTQASVSFSTLSSPPATQFIASRPFRLFFCYIPKNGCTKMKSLFLKLVSSSTAWGGTLDDVHRNFNNEERLRPLLLSEDVQRSILSDRKWLRSVILRDPMKRFISAYLDKIAGRTDLSFFGLKGVHFDGTADSLYKFLGYNATWGWEHHFMLQSRLCGFANSWGWWDHILLYVEDEDMTKSTAAMFDHRIDYLLHEGWGNQSKMWDGWTRHRTSHSTERQNIIGQICRNKTIYDALLKYTLPDYDFFGLFRPTLCS